MTQKTYVVGIGASAGGLEAITQLIAHLKSDIPCAYVILQHLSPSHRSMMVEILGRETSLTVKEAGHGEIPRPGTIYVVPANNNAVLKEGRLHLSVAVPEVVPKPSINQFFIALAAEEGELAMGVVLSGTGSDGVAGLRAIQAAGGFTLAQSPETAKYDGMPRSAIDAGVVDHVLPPDKIAEQIPRLFSLVNNEEGDTAPQDLLERLLGRLQEKLNYDFSGYKTGTLMRRIRRREVATGNPDLASYLNWVDAHPNELDLLSRDILISVTAFFRDHDAFEVLRQGVHDICHNKAPGSEIRVWVAGCASGEEAYSIAMLFADVLGTRLPEYRVQIFATDVDDDALNYARRGIYPAPSMSEIPIDQLSRHFQPVNQAFEAGKHLRDMIVFARHNLVSDPPFLRLDLVSCRNVLIYFDAPLQTKVLRTFHFGLLKQGYLFLGRSESVAHAEQLFQPQDRRERLFRKTGESLSLPALTNSPLKTPLQRRERKFELLLDGLVSHFQATAVLCDSEGSIVHTAGDVQRFLKFPAGATRLGIGEVTVSALRGELMTLLHRCHQTGKPQPGRRRKFDEGWVRVFVDPLQEAGYKWMVILFVPEATAPAEEGQVTADPAVATREIEDELLATREHLQTLVEEMATANEEMQALNEEAQASNEELQATNEELEAANEELQATNEELISLNEEFSVKTAELATLAEEYAHLYDALQFPILVFDRDGQLIRFNAPAQRRFDLRTTAIKQHLTRLKLGQVSLQIETLLGRVLAHADREDTIFEQDGRVFRLSVVPGQNRTGDVVNLVVSMIDVTEITQANVQLAESQARLSALMDKTQVIFAMKDLSGAYVYVNQRFLNFFGLDTQSNYLGKNDFALLPRPIATDFWSLELKALREEAVVHGEHVIDLGGSRRHLRTTHQILQGPDGKPNAIITEAEDVTQTRMAEDQLRITARVFDQAGEAIVVTDPKGVIQTVNAAFVAITGYELPEVTGRSISLLKSGRQSNEFYQAMWNDLQENGFWQGEIWNKRKSGEIYPEWLTINAVDNERQEREHFVAVFSDITQIKESQRKAEFLATHDPLTRLPNRTLFHDRLRHGLALARRAKTRLALLFIDLDNFKTINDTLGHDIGDGLLKQVSDRLRKAVRDIDTIARLGGDEFTAILSDCASDVVDRVAARILDDLGASFSVEHRTLFVSASIGVAFYPEDGADATNLIQAADAAMYRAKEQGRNRVEYFKPDLQIRLHKRAALESALREALRHNRLRLVFQPKFRIVEGRKLVGAEALLRWTDPILGPVSPAEFIPVAEASGLILEVSKVVVALLIERLQEWKKMGLIVPKVAFNVSPRCIREADFAKLLLSAAADAGLSPSELQVEITEGALLDNTTVINDNLEILHGAGLTVAIDDFGTGYSSLAYLKRLPIHELKIDKSFVDGLGQDRNDEAIARAVLALSEALGLQTVAEGVEKEDQLQWLCQHGCHMVQGYLLEKPLETDAFEQLLGKGVRDE